MIMKLIHSWASHTCDTTGLKQHNPQELVKIMKLKKEVKKKQKKLKNISFFKINFFNAFYRVPRGTCFDLSKKVAWLFVHIERQQIFLINFFFK